MESEPAATASGTKRRAARTSNKRKAEPTTAVDAPAPKRSKITKKQGSLHRLLDISLDVLFEIFGHLLPLDVLRLGRVSKEFRRLLFHKSSISIWRSSLANVPGLPPCPPSMTEPQWVSLVFDQTCQVCQKTARKVDWGLFIRICTKCIKPNISVFQILRSEEKFRLTDLVPSRPDTNKPWRTAIFTPELVRVKALHQAMKDPEDQAKFAQERKEIVKDLKERAILCEEWAQGISDNRSEELADLKEERFKAVSAKLTALGWGQELEALLPCDSIKFHKSVKLPTALTERTWNTIKPEMIKYMEQMKIKRLARELAAAVIERKSIAGKVLRAYKLSHLPWTEVMPTAADFCAFPEIDKIIQSPLEVTVDDKTFEKLSKSFPAMFSSWRARIVKALAGKFDLESEDADVALSTLTLATSVYKCTSCKRDDDDGFSIFPRVSDDKFEPLYWPRVLDHGCLTQVTENASFWTYFSDMKKDVPWRAAPLLVDRFAAEIVENVVTACGLDPKTATVEAMDAADVRLACHSCATRKPSPDGKSSDDGPATVETFTWRNAVLHEGDRHFRNPTAWHKLNATETEAARAMEKTLLKKEKVRIPVARDQAGSTDDMPMPDAPAEDAEQATASADAETSADAVMAEPDTDGTQAEGSPNIVPSSLSEIAWTCTHCLDTPRAKPPMALGPMQVHLASVHEIRSAVINQDYFRSRAAPELYTRARFPAPKLDIAVLPAQPEIEPRKVARYPNFGFGSAYSDIYDDMFGGGYDNYSDSEDGYGYGYGGYDDDDW
ncbi:hypothetical protein FB45DRAFT_941736 [Roridomyces roridus]|uniref:F-box domain-containing protein n=1 Tax=Roridomyces roridus TaxID=1738132 RepID=A0AAD7B5P1_9AGAR|nr:hypothetical protein FB45DRAFT_941736 [Roridomyces roridus]